LTGKCNLRTLCLLDILFSYWYIYLLM
jgi:hypothetical protein